MLLSSLGWVDKNSLWIFHTEDETERHANLGNAEYLSLFKGARNHFSVAHHYDKSRIDFSARTFSSPETTLSNLSITNDGHTYEGSLDVWEHLPKAYVEYLSHDGIDDYWLLLLDPSKSHVEYQRFEWFDDSYDHGYQGIIGVTEIPNSHLLIISVQRDSNPVLWDPIEQRVVRKLNLAGAYGNPRLQFSSTDDDLWADDYDSIVKLDPTDWSVKSVKRLQPADNGKAQFIGEFSFGRDETLCIVPRPFSGDVLGVNTLDLSVKHVCNTGGQPLEATMLDDGRVYARDWQTGTLLRGNMKRKLFSLNLN
jgi:hypothetical protein